MADEQKIGPTGEFPDGKIHPTDEGGLAMRLGIDEFNKQIILEFGVPVKWLGLGVEDAVNLAQLILDKAELLHAKGVAGVKVRDGGKDREPSGLGAA